MMIFSTGEINLQCGMEVKNKITGHFRTADRAAGSWVDYKRKKKILGKKKRRPAVSLKSLKQILETRWKCDEVFSCSFWYIHWKYYNATQGRRS